MAALGSFAAAARELGVTPSAVSRQVRALEERLGVRLLHRTTRRVSLTAEGRGFHERLRRVLDDAAEAEEAVRQRPGEPRGPLRIGAPMDFGRAHLVAPLAAFAARYPRVSLDVEFSDRIVDVVEEAFDVVVRIAALPDSTLVARRLAPARRVLCASPAYLAERGTPRSPAELEGHVRIAYAYETEPGWAFRGERRRIVLPATHRANNGHVLCALAREGLGIALIPTFLAGDDVRAGRLRMLLPEALDADVGIHALYPHRRQLSDKVRRLVDLLADHCGAHPRPYWDEGLEPSA